jgi:hypothetical protein
MRTKLEQRKSPLLGITSYPTLSHQSQRYINLGYSKSQTSTLLEYYHALPTEELSRVEGIEEFDEFEEWVIKCQHYFGILFILIIFKLII